MLFCPVKVSSSAGIVSHFVNLQIVVPEATIQGTKSGEHHVDIGSIINLVCVIEKVSPTNCAMLLTFELNRSRFDIYFTNEISITNHVKHGMAWKRRTFYHLNANCAAIDFQKVAASLAIQLSLIETVTHFPP